MSQTRRSWKIGSSVMIFSRSQNKWDKGTIECIDGELEKEWLCVKYGDKKKKIQRYSKDIKPYDPSMGGVSPRSSSCYRFKLAAPGIEFSSQQGIIIFTEALAEGHMNGYFCLAAQFTTQHETTYCGLASLTMVLNSLYVDPQKKWRGHYRWYDEDMLNCNISKEQIKSCGMTFDECVCIARNNGLQVIAKRPEHKYMNNKSKRLKKQYTKNIQFDVQTENIIAPTNKDYNSLQEFREDIILSCVTFKDPQIILCYSRLGLNQVGTGHFSPVGGYNKKRDMVLILDVARFKYPPHWVPLETLYKALCMTDNDNKHRSRGWMFCSVANSTKSYFFTFDKPNITAPVPTANGHLSPIPTTNWTSRLSQTFRVSMIGGNGGFPGIDNDENKCDIGTGNECDVQHEICMDLIACVLLNSFPSPIDEYLESYGEMFGNKLSASREIIKKKILNGIQSSGMFGLICNLFENGNKCIESMKVKCNDDIKIEVITLIILIFSNDTWNHIPNHYEINKNDEKMKNELIELTKIEQHKYPECVHEIKCLRAQLANLDHFFAQIFE